MHFRGFPSFWNCWCLVVIFQAIIFHFVVIIDAQQQQSTPRGGLPETYYSILNVTVAASEEEIKRQYRRLALIYHPDRFSFHHKNQSESSGSESDVNPGVAMFLKIQQAYEILSDPERRKQYDLSFDGIKYDIHVTREESDEFNSLRYQSRPFELFARTRKWKLHFHAEFPKKKIDDVVINLSIDFKHTLTGYQKQHVYYRKKICEACSGTGGLDGHCPQCPWCNGRGIGPHVFSQPGVGYEHLTRTRCAHCKGKGCIPTTKCPVCNGHGISVTESLVDIHLPIGFPDGLSWVIPRAGHMDVDDAQRVGDIAVSVKYNMPPGWKYDMHSGTLLYILYANVDDLLMGFQTKVMSPYDEVIPVDIPVNLSLAQILFDAITVTAQGFGGPVMYDPNTAQVVRGNAVIQVKADVKTIAPETFLSFLEEQGLDRNDPLFKRFFAFIFKQKSGPTAETFQSTLPPGDDDSDDDKQGASA